MGVIFQCCRTTLNTSTRPRMGELVGIFNGAFDMVAFALFLLGVALGVYLSPVVYLVIPRFPRFPEDL